MAFFEKLGKKLSDAGQGAAQQAKNLTDTTRLNGKIVEKERAIAKLYSALGKAYFERCKDDPSAANADLMQQISEHLGEIDHCRQEIQKIRGVKKCPSCGADVTFDAAFCNTCGAKLAVETAAEESAESPLTESVEEPVEEAVPETSEEV